MKETGNTETLRFVQILKVLAHPVRWEIVNILNDSKKPLSFIQIKQYLVKIQGEEYSDGNLWVHLNLLVKTGLLEIEKEIEINEEMGKAIICFYKITKLGTLVITHLEKLKRKIEKKLKG